MRKPEKHHPASLPPRNLYGHDLHVAILLSRHETLPAQRRIIERARKRNWRIHDLRHYNNRLPDNFTPDGIFTDLLWDAPELRPFRKSGLPIVRIGRFVHPKDNVFPAVVVNMTAIAEMAAEHFAERNFQHVGFVAFDRIAQHYRYLFIPFRTSAIERGMQCHLLKYRELSPEEDRLPYETKARIRGAELMEWLKRVPKPIAILGLNEYMSARICSLSLDAGFDIPQDVAILSCGNDPLVCECTPIQLSALATSGDEEGDAAVDLLQSLMAGNPPPKSTVFVTPQHISVRESTDVLATTSPEVANAIRFMWDHIRESLSVEDIANAIEVPRRKLERKFQQQLGRGINAELLRRRLEHCCKLLRDTDLPILDIVPAVGLSSAAYLHKAFLRAFQMTPKQWRDQHRQHAKDRRDL